MTMTQIPVGDFIGTELYRNYLLNFHRVSGLFKYNPWNESSYEERLRELQEREETRGDIRNRLSIALHNYHHKFTDNPAVFNSIELMKNSDTMTVATGQQPGVLTGPLFAIYKAVTAIKLAESLSQKFNRTVIPVFWLASEDHDFQEVNWIKTVNHKGEQVSCQISNQNEGKSIKNREIENQGKKILGFLEEHFKGTTYYDKWISLFQKTEQDTDNLADWTAQILLELFGDMGLLILDPMEQGIRNLSSEVFRRAIDLGEDYYQIFCRTDSCLRELGYSRQVDLKENHTGLFYYYQGDRTPIIADDDKYKLENLNVEFTYEQILNELKTAPQNFSPNVTLRPIVQDYLLPNLAYVGGPGEVSYFSQLQSIYENINVEMPIIYPRESYLLVEADQSEFMENYNITIDGVFNNWSNIRKQVYKDIAPVDSEDVFQDAVTKFRQGHNDFVQQLAQIDENVRELEKKNFHLIMRQLEYLKEKTDYYFRKRQTDIERQLNFVKKKVYPNDKLQEREYNIGEFLFKYDYKLINDLINKPLNPRQINVVFCK